MNLDIKSNSIIVPSVYDRVKRKISLNNDMTGCTGNHRAQSPRAGSSRSSPNSHCMTVTCHAPLAVPMCTGCYSATYGRNLRPSVADFLADHRTELPHTDGFSIHRTVRPTNRHRFQECEGSRVGKKEGLLAVEFS